MTEQYLKKIIMVRKGKHCGNLGNEDRYYDDMNEGLYDEISRPTKRKPSLSDAIFK